MLILTTEAVYLADETAPSVTPMQVLEEAATCGEATANGGVAALSNGDLAIIAKGEIHRLALGMEEEVRCLHVLSEDPMQLLVGTEPPHLFRIVTGGEPARGAQSQVATSQCATSRGSVSKLPAFDELACRDRWYTPWGGPPAVRCLAHSGNRVYADIHVGSIMRSSDQGDSWQPVTPDLHDDVHQVATCPAAPERVYANTAHAVYVSDDGGDSWRHRADGLPNHYGRAITVHPGDADCLLASVSGGPHAEGTGRLFRSDDAGSSWSHVRNGFPKTVDDNIDTFHITFDAGGGAWAADGPTLYRSGDRGVSWSATWTAPANILAVS